MPIEFSADTPIYLQLIGLIRQSIASGERPPGSKMPSVRDLAIEFGVNPNTVQRALSELERDGLLFTERTAGRYITEDAARIAAVRAELAERQIETFLQQMKVLGFKREDLLRVLEKKWSEQNGHD
jgi:GntR family transcriptional regulator